MPGAALADVLVDAVALAGDEPLARCPRSGRAPRPGRRRARASSRSRRPAGRPCRTAARRAGRSRTRWPSEPGAGLAGHQVDGAPGDPGAGRGDRRGPARRRARPAASDRSGTAKKPQLDPTSARTPMPGVLVLGRVLDLAVAGRHRLVPPVHHPGVGVARPASSAAWTAASAASNSVIARPYGRGRERPGRPHRDPVRGAEAQGFASVGRLRAAGGKGDDEH